MNINKKAQTFFEDNAVQWSLRGYNYIDHNYPVALHRRRILLKIIKSNKIKKLKFLDIGCGSGDNLIEIAKLGHSIVGVDSSKKMLNLAKSKIDKLSNKISKNIILVHKPILEYKDEHLFDICICMGVIGYIDNEINFLKHINKLLKKNGNLIISSRNRLFNIQSLSFRTLNEINNKKFKKLYDEMKSYYKPLKNQSINLFLKNITKLNFTKIKNKNTNKNKIILKKNYLPFTEPKQQTPLEMIKLSKRSNFKVSKFYGVHPHIIDPSLNKMLPEKVFNQMSDALTAFEEEKISLVWSSVFISVLKKSK